MSWWRRWVGRGEGIEGVIVTVVVVLGAMLVLRCGGV